MQCPFRRASQWAVALFCVFLLASNCFAAQSLSLEERTRQYNGSYTLEDLAAVRLAVYGILEERYRTPQEDTAAPLSRLEALELLRKVFGAEDSDHGSIPFADVPEEKISTVAWAYQNGIASGRSKAMFGTEAVTEQEFMTMLLNALGRQGEFDFSEAIGFGRSVGLAPVGQSGAFSLGDAALYLQEAIQLAGANEIHANIPTENMEQADFPVTVTLYPASADEVEAQVRAAMCYLPSRVVVTGSGLTKNELCRLFLALLNDHEDISSRAYQQEHWYFPMILEYSALVPSMSVGKDAAQLNIQIQYNEAWKLACDADDAFTLYKDGVLSRLADQFYESSVAGASEDMEAVKRAEQVILEQASYASSYQTEDGARKYAPETHSILGFFENGQIVCDGYAKLFQYLMHRAGIPCVVVHGSTKSQEAADSRQANHAWNKIRIGDIWYNIDTCWADSDRTGKYVLKSNEEFITLKHWPITYSCL